MYRSGLYGKSRGVLKAAPLRCKREERIILERQGFTVPGTSRRNPERQGENSLGVPPEAGRQGYSTSQVEDGATKGQGGRGAARLR